MKALVSPQIPTPFTVDYLVTSTGTIRHVTNCLEMSTAMIWNYVGIGVGLGVIVVEDAKCLLFKVLPTKRPSWVKDKVRLGDPVTEFFRVGKVGAPGDVPINLHQTTGDACRGPIHGSVPRRIPAVPSFAVKAAHMLRERSHTNATDII